MTPQSIFLIFAMVLIGCGSATSADDIAGLKIGMTPEEARQALPRINPKFKIVESSGPRWNTLTMNASVPDERIVLRFTETQPKAWFIGRSIVYPKGQRPTKENLHKDLIAKYGTPTKATDQHFSWSTSSPKQSNAPTPYDIHGCGQLPSDEGQWSAGVGAPFFLRIVTRECDKLIEAIPGKEFGENAEIAAGLAIAITDFALARSDPKHPENVGASNQKRQIEEARKNKPKL